MTARDRYLAALNFSTVDRVPFEPGGPRESTRAAWHRQGLPEGVPWFRAMAEHLGRTPEELSTPGFGLPVDARMRPTFEEKVLEHRDGHYVVQDWKGNVCEIADTFDVSYLRNAKDFVTRRWIRCPVERRADWDAMRERYRADDPTRVPEDLGARCEQALAAGAVRSLVVTGPFWQLREWCGFEGLCERMIDDPEWVEEMAAFWCAFVDALLARVLAVAAFDRIFIQEDMAYKGAAMISPEMTRRFCLPSWQTWTRRLRAAGVPLIDMDSDGYVGELIPIWLEAGINVCDPIEVAAHNDIAVYRARYGRDMAYRMGVDKRAMAAGGEVMRRELARLAPVVEDGGFIPGCDHGIPSDVSWPDFLDYAAELARLTGWR